MSAQDRTEQVLRNIHILFSNCEVYDEKTNRIIVDKKEMLKLLNDLTVCMGDLMDEYELNQQGQDKREREAKKIGEEIIKDASRKAEDVYAASVIYTDEALRHVQDIMQTAADSVQQLYQKMAEELAKEKEVVRSDQSELQGHLLNLVDTEKYLKIIEDSNKEIEKEKAKDKEKEWGEPETAAVSAGKPEIRINTELLRQSGITYEEEFAEEVQETKETVTADVSVNLDAEYFQWKETGSEGTKSQKQEKHTLFSRFGKNSN